MLKLRVPHLLRLVFVHNPFYLISAFLFVIGLKQSFPPDANGYFDPWNLMYGLAGITTLMAVTTWAVVRFGQVWEDARSLILTTLLMLVAISVSLDELITLSARDDAPVAGAIRLAIFAMGFSILVSEAVLRSLRIQLSWLYRLPLYGLLSLFFVFPLWVSPEVSLVSIESARWRIAAFPAFAAVIALSLLPAIRTGSTATRDNGTPWAWPWYPWSLFAVVAAAVCFRAWSLAISFDVAFPGTTDWDTSFDLCFLIPFLIAVLVLLMEVSLVENLPRLRNAILLAAPALLLLAIPEFGRFSHYYSHSLFLAEFTDHAASPAWLTLFALASFYLWAWVRGIAAGEAGLICMLLAMSKVAPRPMLADELVFQIAPLLAIVFVEVAAAVTTRRMRPVMVAALTGLQIASLSLEPSLHEFWRTVGAMHLILVAVLVHAAFRTSRTAERTRDYGCAAVVPIVLWAACGAPEHGGTLAHISLYLLTVSLLTALYGHWVRRRIWYVLAGAALSGSMGCVTGHFRRQIEEVTVPPGIRTLLLASACFVSASAISLVKGRLQLGRAGTRPVTGTRE